jgi:hypothetical protein
MTRPEDDEEVQEHIPIPGEDGILLGLGQALGWILCGGSPEPDPDNSDDSAA